MVLQQGGGRGGDCRGPLQPVPAACLMQAQTDCLQLSIITSMFAGLDRRMGTGLAAA